MLQCFGFDREFCKYLRDKSGGKEIYTVDEVSSLLGVPRPTLYRYLREYSIPHVRQAGRIAIPEDSVDLIREARELHEEGMSIESVRRRLREGEVDFRTLLERLDEISQSVRELREGVSRREAVEPSALKTLSEQMESLISAVFTLTEISESLLANTQEEPGDRIASLERRLDELSEQMESLMEMATYLVNVASVLKPNSRRQSAE
ncbi:helix-turn-helix domain-containing protein [Rubrobacter taiwanensis]|uniref:Helix-turn-helix domain-containing protein n=1 Tax=Rubrobacter taiwanensis TaxID=185139 RepID=A0A4R1BSH3_9ACTN|nr:helix-turn-helix domain-containing protein [Rubrobacter taiwanensis]TCJ20789.1 helix-turn-helix domain-containing protein [Rubrobacter taiwanensis]